jgi:hypothetical protein
MQKQTRSKKILFLIGFLFVFFVVYNVSLSFSRSGKTRVDVDVIPGDSKITINDHRSKKGSNYLKPGTYTFKATAEGFEEFTYTIEVKKDPLRVGLVPSPQSEDAKKWLTDNPEIQLQREALGGGNYTQKGTQIESETPLIAQLPYTDIDGPFSINYGYAKNRENGIYLLIGDSSANGRKAALNWLRNQGQDPTNLEIRFGDFTNPLTSNGSTDGNL